MGALSEAILGGVVKLTKEGNAGMSQCHCVAYSSQHQWRVVLFYVLTTYIYVYYCFLNIKQTQKNTGGL